MNRREALTTGSYGIITGVDNTVTAVISRRHILIIFRMAQRTRQLMTKRSRCKCDDADQLRLPICGCGDHEAALRNITLALERWGKAERDFFREYAASGRKCCGTMDG